MNKEICLDGMFMDIIIVGLDAMNQIRIKTLTGFRGIIRGVHKLGPDTMVINKNKRSHPNM